MLLNSEGKGNQRVDFLVWWILLLKIVLGLVLVLAIIGSGAFGYVFWIARARGWAAGCFCVLALCAFALYKLIIW